MTDTNCVRCGIVNRLSNEVCIACGADLQILKPPPVRESALDWQPLTEPDDPFPGIYPFRGVGDILSPTIDLFTRNLWLITKIVFVVVAPFEIFQVMSLGDVENDWQLTAVTFVLGAICQVLIAPALIYALMKTIQTGVAPGVNESYRWGLSRLAKLCICAAIAWALQLLGYALCIIPGIIISLALELVYPLAVLEKGSPAEILRRSSELTRGRRWKIFLAVIVIALLTSVISVPASLLTLEVVGFWPVTVLAAILVDIVEQAHTVLSLVIYLSILRTPQWEHSIPSLTK